MGIAKESIKNLKRGNPAWVKGVSGNPKGRKKNGDCIISIARRMLAEKIPGQTITWEESIAHALIRQSSAGNLSAIKELLDRLYGRSKESVEVSGAGGGPIVVRNLTDAELEAYVASHGS